MIGTTDYISIKLTDETQFRSIFDKYYISLCMFANQYVENDALAADIVQECFVKLWQLRDDFMYVHQIKSFLYTSVRNKSLNELEHTKVILGILPISFIVIVITVRCGIVEWLRLAVSTVR